MAPPKGHKFNENREDEGGRPERYTAGAIEAYAKELLDWSKKPTNIWFKDFCLEKDIDPDLMSVWSKENAIFGHAHRMAKARQESRVVRGGLEGAYNSSAMKFVLMNAHDWKDKSEQKVSGDAVNPLAFILQNIDGNSKELINDEQE